MIKVLRVDDRLLHGQVAVAWTSHLQVDTILIANNRLVEDQTMQIAFKLAAPPEVVLSMKTLDGAVAVINNPKHLHRTILVITKTIEDAEYLCQQTMPSVKEVLIGGLRSGDGKKQVDQNSYLDEGDMRNLEMMNDLGVSITMQAVPSAKKYNYADIVKNYNK